LSIGAREKDAVTKRGTLRHHVTRRRSFEVQAERGESIINSGKKTTSQGLKRRGAIPFVRKKKNKRKEMRDGKKKTFWKKSKWGSLKEMLNGIYADNAKKREARRGLSWDICRH